MKILGGTDQLVKRFTLPIYKSESKGAVVIRDMHINHLEAAIIKKLKVVNVRFIENLKAQLGVLAVVNTYSDVISTDTELNELAKEFMYRKLNENKS